jgi:hypothetical protein
MSENTATYEIENMEDAHAIAEMLDNIEHTPRRESSSQMQQHGSKEMEWRADVMEMRRALRSGVTGRLEIRLEVDDDE